MTTASENYNLEREIAAFFSKTTATRSACNRHAKELVGGDVTAVPVQGVCSYTVYAGPDASIVVQFRLQSLALPFQTISEAHRVYGHYAPDVKFSGNLGEEDPSGVKESLLVYIMPRIKGVSHLEFLLNHGGYPVNSSENQTRRLNLIVDCARFFALSWKRPCEVDHAQSDILRRSYETELRLLLTALPERFHALLHRCLNTLSSIMALPYVLTHKDFGAFNVVVDPDTCHLNGVIDWAEATVEPFGINLSSVQGFMGHFHLRRGFEPYANHEIADRTFWAVLGDEVGERWTAEIRDTVEMAMIMGLFLTKGFTSRLANEPRPTPVKDDERGKYNMMYLDGYLVNPMTKII